MLIREIHKFIFFLINKFHLFVAGIGIAVFLFIFIQIFCFTSFAILSYSMKPTLLPGDYVLVNKMIPGARLFDLFAAMRKEQVVVYRLPGIRMLDRNDIIVFNYPHPYTWEKLQMHIMRYYIKRCIGLPGDTLTIKNGNYHINNGSVKVGNEMAQKRLSTKNKKNFEQSVYTTFPYDSLLNWNILNFGPFYIPKKGDSITLDQTKYLLYKKAIEWEQKDTLIFQDSVFYLHQKQLTTYCFHKNYYFVAGDEVENSQDSRYFGILPEDFIVGKAWLIWKSKDKYTGENRGERFFKSIK